MKGDAGFLAALVVLCALRLLAGALLPLSSDEAYYWLWSRHLAAGYFDHPPAIAFLIRAGTLIFGDTPFGVRAGAIILSFATSWFVWRLGAILGRDEKVGALACLFFNLTLMASVEMLAATPDAPSIATSAAFCWALAKLAESKDGRWWIVAGLAAGLGLLSKYSAFFLGAGTILWLIASPPMRRWIASPWPYLGAALALVVFAPNLWWNATYGWETFGFQLARVESGHFTLRFLFEFLGAQAALASPFILVLGVFDLCAATAARRERLALIAAILWPSILYFSWHSLHDRVQGNWPCFLYPMLCVAAALALHKTDWTGWRAYIVRWSGRIAVPFATVVLLAGYAQALMGVVPLDGKDPVARLLATGLPKVADELDQLRSAQHAKVILTTDYASAAWFSFYAPGHPPIVDIGEDYRWSVAPKPDASLMTFPALYICETRRDRRDIVASHFTQIVEIARIDRKREGIPIAHYVVYRVSGPKGAPVGRMP
jgi:4-amino-4-deoxy-L-arabinose transferase-like glycosyltransferase